MSDVPVPSYRVRPSDPGGPPWRMIAFGGGLCLAVAVGAAITWSVSRMGGPRSVPLIEADARPFKVRPDDPGGMRVPNQDELIFERDRHAQTQIGGARLAPEPEAPRIDALRAQVAPPPAPAVTAEAPAAPQARPGATPAPEAPAAVATAPPAEAPAPAAAASRVPAPVANGRVRVQLGALVSEDAARGEWERLQRRIPEFLEGREPQILRFERQGQSTLWRLRTGGFGDTGTAREFCDQLRGQNIPCMVIRG